MSATSKRLQEAKNGPVKPKPRRPSVYTLEVLAQMRRCHDLASKYGLKVRKDRATYRSAARQGGWRINGPLVLGANFELSLDQVELFLNHLAGGEVLPARVLTTEHLRVLRKHVRQRAREAAETWGKAGT